MEINLCKNEAEVFSCGFNVFDLCKFFSPRLILSAKFSRIFLSHSTPSGFQSFFKTFLNGMVKADNSLSSSNSEETTLSKSFCENPWIGLSFIRQFAKLSDFMVHLIPRIDDSFSSVFQITLQCCYKTLLALTFNFLLLFEVLGFYFVIA